MYRPRSRGGMIEARMTWARAVRPPAPRPCTTRKAISIPVFCDRPAAAEPTMKMTRESCTSSFLLVRSASLPQIGVETVVASRVLVTTQV